MLDCLRHVGMNVCLSSESIIHRSMLKEFYMATLSLIYCIHEFGNEENGKGGI